MRQQAPLDSQPAPTRPRPIATAVVFAALAAWAGTASGVAVTPGGFVSPLPPTTVAAEPQLAGTVVEDVIRTVSGTYTTSAGSGPFEGAPFSIELQDRVVRAVDGTYDFYYRVTSLSGPDFSVFPVGLDRTGFAGFATSVAWRSDGLGSVAPENAFRSASGDTIGFRFGYGVLPPGSTSRFMLVDTDATAYAATGAGRLDVSPSFNVSGYASFPTFAPAVPEPQTWALFGLGLLALAGLRARRRGASPHH